MTNTFDEFVEAWAKFGRLLKQRALDLLNRF